MVTISLFLKVICYTLCNTIIFKHFSCRKDKCAQVQTWRTQRCYRHCCTNCKVTLQSKRLPSFFLHNTKKQTHYSNAIISLFILDVSVLIMFVPYSTMFIDFYMPDKVKQLACSKNFCLLHFSCLQP